MFVARIIIDYNKFFLVKFLYLCSDSPEDSAMTYYVKTVKFSASLEEAFVALLFP